MARYVGKVTTRRPPEEAFDYLANFASVAEWDPSVERARALDPDPRRVGARFEVEVGFLGRTTELEYRTVELDRPKRVAVRAETGALTSYDTIAFRPLPGGGTEITYDADLRLKGVRRIADLPLRVLFGRLAENARSGLQKALAGTPRTRVVSPR